MKRYFAVSDIHGHYKELKSLMSQLKTQAKLNPKEDTLVFLGDYIDGGPDSARVVRQLIKWSKQYPHWVFLFGNHESLMLDAFNPRHPIYGDYYIWYNQGGKATLDSYKASKKVSEYQKAIMQSEDVFSLEDRQWLSERPYYFETDKYFFVHAGLIPKPISEHDFQDPDTLYQMIWIRDQFILSNFKWEKKVIFGHTHTEAPIVWDNKIGIDTMAHNTGHLTAVELPAEKFYYSKS